MRNLLILCVAVIVFSSCEEVGPNIIFTEPEAPLLDSSFVADNIEEAQLKNILMEEFTGVRCPNCPAGAELAEQLAAANPGRVQIVSIHSGFFSIPFPNEPDFKISEGEEIEALLGLAAGYPSAALDRKTHAGENTIIVTSNSWQSIIDNTINTPTSVNVNLETEWDGDTRKLTIRTNTHFTAALSGDYRLSIALLENDIVSPQDVDGVVVDTYVHKHVLRGMVTPFNGIPLATDPVAGETFLKDYEVEGVDASWIADNLEVVVFVNQAGNTIEVLQVNHASVL